MLWITFFSYWWLKSYPQRSLCIKKILDKFTILLISYRHGRGLKCEPVYKVGSRLSQTGKTGNERANKMLDDEAIERRKKYLKIIQDIASKISNEDFCILLDVFYIEMLKLKPSNEEFKNVA